MSPVTFWMALIGAASLSGLVLSYRPSTLAGWLVAALPLIATSALAWIRWVKRPALWLGRLAAGVCMGLVAILVSRWLADPATASFRTIWPVVFVWAVGCGLQAFTITGWTGTAGEPAGKFPVLLWRLAVIAWTLACGWLLARSLSPTLAVDSLIAAAQVLGIILVPIAAIVLLVYVIGIPGRRRARRARADFERMAPSARREIFDFVQREALTGPYQQYHVAVDTPSADSAVRCGGLPRVSRAAAWPVDAHAVPATFLLQLPLGDPLPEPWCGRRISVYMTADELVVLSEADPGHEGINAEPPAGARLLPAQATRSLVLPQLSAMTEDGPADLLEWRPALYEQLAPYGRDPDELLTKILMDDAAAVHFHTAAALRVGGLPWYVQGEHDARCTHCGGAMRFLFQFDDFSDDLLLGDAGVAYVYGCDAHPQHCRAFVDEH
ncbi:hypothetical protein [Tahibacter amnicola]|uniref:Uncharacterized protein n=1 Tax=Tahibacter amnicola TaxID=2976241 RepID=A0ABY6BFW6_9GAMM|nr:hypothetical protein [Tahibacter amnicola]UXI67985.1 hypothetical protein N4264_25200 [Tahibacter amnicola]